MSVACTLLALMFGDVKGHFTGANPVRSALQTALVGGLARLRPLVLRAPFPDGLTKFFGDRQV